MKRFAANILLINNGLVKNAMVEIDDNNIISKIIPLSEFSNEPAFTLFYNGVLSKYPLDMIDIGVKLAQQENIFIKVDDKVECLALWKNISLEELIINKDTELVKL